MAHKKKVNHFKIVAVAGSHGELAHQIRVELLKHIEFATIVSLRNKHGDKDDTEATVRGKSLFVDYADIQEVSGILQQVDILISVLGGTEGLRSQFNLAKAAKQANVKLFVPSDFLFDGLTEEDIETPLSIKADLRTFIKELDLPYFSIFPGIFPEILFHPRSAFGFDFDQKQARIIGNGQEQISFTTKIDTARFLAHILLHQSKEELVGKHFHIQGDHKSLNEIVTIFEKITKSQWKVTRESPEECVNQLRAHPTSAEQFLEVLQLAQARGIAQHKQNTLDNDLMPEWHPALVEEILYDMYAKLVK